MAHHFLSNKRKQNKTEQNRMFYALFALIALIAADLIWITINTHKGIYSHLRNDQKHFFSISTPFQIPLTVFFRNPDLSLPATICCAIFGWLAPFIYLFLKLDTNGSHLQSALDGLELAAVVYAVFNATSYLTFPIWRRWLYNVVPIAFIDTCWGCTLYAGTSALIYELAQW